VDEIAHGRNYYKAIQWTESFSGNEGANSMGYA